MPTATKVNAFLVQLDKHAAGELHADAYNRVLYSADASIYQVMPHAVLVPKTIDDVQMAVSLAAQHQIPILPRTAGSSLAGQAVNEALVIDFTRHLDQVTELNAEERWVRVQPGIVLDELNAYLRPHGLQFGPDPASSNRAAMGGIVSNNSTGSHSIMYGMTADHVLEMNVILNDSSTAHFAPLKPAELKQKLAQDGREGDIYRAVHQLANNPANRQIINEGTPRHWRRCGGYNLDRMIGAGERESGGAGEPSFQWPIDSRFNLSNLITGAEGTLAVITELKLNLVPLPTMTALAIVHFDALFTALTAVPTILEVGPSVVEVLDNLALTMCRDVPEYARLLDTFIEGQPNCVLITEFYGETEGDLRLKIDGLKTHLRENNAGHIAMTTAFKLERQANVWKVRKVGLGLLMSIKGDHKPIPFIEDAAVPVAHLAEYVHKVEDFCHSIGTEVAYYAHASAGCLHIRPLINAKKASEVAKLPQITEFSVDLLKGYGGSFSSEHGDGRARSWLNEAFFGPDLYNLYRQVKQIFDPINIFNPGNIVDAGPMTENLRFGPDYRFIPITPHLDFSEHGDTEAGGFDRAVEMCNGAAICRKRTMDTMCPSFQTTRDEMHSTRGRANLLRAAFSGKLSAVELTSPHIYEAMDLCIECKACKAECPSSVDMAKIKFEFLAQYYETNGIPLRVKFIGAIPQLNRFSGGAMAPLANWAIRNPLIRAGMERFLGIAAHRALPEFARIPFTKWFAERAVSHRVASSPLHRVILFADPFTTYTEPDIAIAAVELLEAARFEVLVADVGDDGRSAISKGLVHKARRDARATVDKLAPFAAQGIPIVGLEPSSLLSLRDEYLYLLPGDEKAQLVADHALTFEEFIAQLADAGELNLTFTDEPRHILLHGHCHQKALVGTVPSHKILSLPPNYTVEEVDSGCCGMAGSFGYEVEHVEISMQMAERRLLPAIRAANKDTIVAAAGTSCRHQIREGTDGRRALHPAEILRAALSA
ncbi:MAG: FAD-binding protein [Chloroflexi bacterium]|nr:FAD-binding protein [Chloroflexota bacterium]